MAFACCPTVPGYQPVELPDRCRPIGRTVDPATFVAGNAETVCARERQLARTHLAARAAGRPGFANRTVVWVAPRFTKNAEPRLVPVPEPPAAPKPTRRERRQRRLAR